ncbi:glutathione S-transferase family protein [Pseudomonadales bacterium]|nr:glutathione S-transferase family protein [Pseudomonadales bacterium]
MTDLILHQYAASPFSEKVRCLLGYKQQSYRTVEIPVIMPKPDLMALTGGYRKTPVLQVGADIYCDTAIICRLIDRLYPVNSVYPNAQMATLGAAAHWTDTFLFKVSVAVAFQPKALAGSDLFNDPASAEAFMADRADFSKGSTELGIDLSVAEPHWLMHMGRLDNQLATANFLGGDAPNILDFSTYHCCWFVYKNEVLQSDLEGFPALAQWMARMAAFGHGNSTAMTGEAAIEVARNSAITVAQNVIGAGLSQGDHVAVMPIDYGFQPTQGALLHASLEELVVKRVDERVGEVAVHFPRLGFQVNKVI